MKKRNRIGEGIFVLAAMASAAPLAGVAAEPARVNMDRPMLESLMPAERRPVEASPPTQGAALQAQVERKLAERFTAADVKRTGTLTREQAQAAGLGFVVNHFDQIDRRKTGVVRFDDVKHFLRENGALLN